MKKAKGGNKTLWYNKLPALLCERACIYLLT